MNSKRYVSLCQMMAMRQSDLTICLEEMHKPHKVSAVIRTADFVGIHKVRAIWPTEPLQTQLSSIDKQGKLSQVNLGGQQHRQRLHH
jgi:tRNA (guanosine-2'-O-)-methyltransferase